MHMNDFPNSERASSAPGRGVRFEVEVQKTIAYRLARWLAETLVKIYWRPTVIAKSAIPQAGPVLLTPVHRSFADFIFTAILTDRKIFFMAKDSLWNSKILGRLLISWGAFPVHRESPDREALSHAEEVLKAGQILVLFPEGTRQDGFEIGDLLEGAAFLSARTGAPIVPIGIAGSDRSMPKGKKIPKPIGIDIVVGEPLSAPQRSVRGRVSRTRVHEVTLALGRSIQSVYDEARDRQASRR